MLFFLFSVKCDEYEKVDIPFEVDEQEEDFAGDDDENLDEEIEKEEADVRKAPTPPQKVSIPLRDIIGKREVYVGIMMAVYLAFYCVGRMIVSRKIKEVNQKLPAAMRKHFAVVNDKFYQRNRHDFDSYMSGRKGYMGCVTSLRFAKTCDILGYLKRVIFSETDRVIFDFLLDPKNEFAGMVHVSKAKPYFADDLKLKQHSIGNRLQLYEDIGDENRKVFTKLINDFNEEHPGSLQCLEMSNTNRFETRDNDNYVVHFELNVIGSPDTFYNQELIDSIVKIADTFTMLKLPNEIQYKNERTRILLNKKNQPKEEKPLTKEKESKLEKKRERKENKRIHPTFKAGK